MHFHTVNLMLSKCISSKTASTSGRCSS